MFVLVCVSCFKLFRMISNNNEICIAMTPSTQYRERSEHYVITGHNSIWWVLQRHLWTVRKSSKCCGAWHDVTARALHHAWSESQNGIWHHVKTSWKKKLFYIFLEGIVMKTFSDMQNLSIARSHWLAFLRKIYLCFLHKFHGIVEIFGWLAESITNCHKGQNVNFWQGAN